MSTTPLIHVVDDDPSMRTALLRLLGAAGFETRGYSSTGEFLLQPLPDRPGCLLLDLRMPGPSGLELQAALLQKKVMLPIVFLTGHGSVDSSVRAMKAGAVDFIEKPFASETLLDSLDGALSRLASPSERDPATDTAVTKLALLSSREREVLEGLLAGLPNKSIAYDLAISPRTVEIHRARVMDKMGARSLSELIRLALAAGMRPWSQ